MPDTRPIRAAAPGLSPCIGVCSVDGRAQVCTGCGRTLKEISQWSGYESAVQMAILCTLPARLEALGAQADDPERALARIHAALATPG